MKLYFAGCARDCAEVVASNIRVLLKLAENWWCDELRIFVIENNSKDNTRDVLVHFACHDKRVVPIFLGNLDEVYPSREARIAFCRDRLLDEIFDFSSDGLYVPIDLDIDLTSSLMSNTFMRSCRLVESGFASGVFPASFPYYYDIHALRIPTWCPDSCWKEIQDAHPRGHLWSLFVYIRYVSLRQKKHSGLLAKGVFFVDSAFGGLGIYSLREVRAACARYYSPDLDDIRLKLCEHVVFNSYFTRLIINPFWVVAAPPEHIEFRILPVHLKFWRIVRAGLRDFRNLVYTRHALNC